jgi:hypothetical protein
MNGRSMDLGVVGGTVKREMPFYEGVRSIEVDVDIMRWRFTAVVVANAEGDVSGALVMLEACWNRRCGSLCWSSS